MIVLAFRGPARNATSGKLTQKPQVLSLKASEEAAFALAAARGAD